MYIICGLIVLGSIAVDQITKLIAINGLYMKPSIELIKNFFYLTYVENRGAGWGLLSGYRYTLILLPIIFLFFLIYFIFFKQKFTKLFYYATSLVVAGAIGNLIDRVFRGYVVDFFNFYIFGYDFPVFNVADCCIVVGVIAMAILILTNKYELKPEDKSE